MKSPEDRATIQRKYWRTRGKFLARKKREERRKQELTVEQWIAKVGLPKDQ